MKTARFTAKGNGSYAASSTATMKRSRANVELCWPCGTSATVRVSDVRKALALKKGEWLFVYDRSQEGGSHFVTKVGGNLYLVEGAIDAECFVEGTLLTRYAYADVKSLRKALNEVTS